MAPQRTWVAFPRRIIRLQDDGNTSGLCQLGQEAEESGMFQKFPLVLHAFKAWLQQALGGKEAKKKVNSPYLGEKSCDMNLHEQMHVQHNCVNSREWMVGNLGRLCWEMSVVVQNGQWGSIFNPMGSKASLMV